MTQANHTHPLADLRHSLRKLGQTCKAGETSETLIPKRPKKSEEHVLAEARDRFLKQFQSGNTVEIAFRMVQRKRMSPEAATAWMLEILKGDNIWKPHEKAN